MPIMPWEKLLKDMFPPKKKKMAAIAAAAVEAREKDDAPDIVAAMAWATVETAVVKQAVAEESAAVEVAQGQAAAEAEAAQLVDEFLTEVAEGMAAPDERVLKYMPHTAVRDAQQFLPHHFLFGGPIGASQQVVPEEPVGEQPVAERPVVEQPLVSELPVAQVEPDVTLVEAVVTSVVESAAAAAEVESLVDDVLRSTEALLEAVPAVTVAVAAPVERAATNPHLAFLGESGVPPSPANPHACAMLDPASLLSGASAATLAEKVAAASPPKPVADVPSAPLQAEAMAVAKAPLKAKTATVETKVLPHGVEPLTLYDAFQIILGIFVVVSVVRVAFWPSSTALAPAPSAAPRSAEPAVAVVAASKPWKSFEKIAQKAGVVALSRAQPVLAISKALPGRVRRWVRRVTQRAQPEAVTGAHE